MPHIEWPYPFPTHTIGPEVGGNEAAPPRDGINGSFITIPPFAPFEESAMNITPEQVKALVTMLLPLVDQLVAQNGSMIVKAVWPFIRSFIAQTDAKAFAAAQGSLPADSQVV